jgi:hypothetical protein
VTTLLPEARYRQLTGDHTSAAADVERALTDAQRLVEEYLRRPLELAERTERLRVYHLNGARAVYPKATPIQLVPAGLTVEGAAVVGADALTSWAGWSSRSDRSYVEITYTGGYTDITLPLTIGREIARTAQQLLSPATAQAIPGGAKSVRVGDVAVTLDRPAGGALDSTSTRALRGYVRRRAA